MTTTPTIVTPELLKTMSYCVTDIECLHDVDMKHFKFDDAEFLGLATACVVDQNDDYRDFVHNSDAFRYLSHLLKHKLIITYNGEGFDYPLLGGALLYANNPQAKRYIQNLFKGRTVDLAQDFKEALGHRIGLNKVSIPTLGDHKEMDGAKAPAMFRNGKILEVLEYNRGDLRRTKDLFIKAVNGEELKVETRSGIKTFKCQVKLR